MATGSDFPDGLSAGPAAAARRAPVILVSDATAQVPPLLDWAGVRGPIVATLAVFGGTGVVPLSLQQ